MRRLIVRPGAIGDFIVSLPAMEKLRADYTEVWTAGVNVPLARFADRARSITSAGLDRVAIVEAGDVVKELRTFDSIVSWYGTNRADFRRFVGDLGLPFSFHPALPADGRVHAVDFFLNHVGAAPGRIPYIEMPSPERADFAALHPFSGGAKKNWPIERFQELAVRLERRMPVQWCRGPEDRLSGAVSIPDLYELGRWVHSARVFVGNDSGITHLAAAVGTPTVALFGPTDSNVWAPRGASVQVIARPSMAEISVAEVDLAVG